MVEISTYCMLPTFTFTLWSTHYSKTNNRHQCYIDYWSKTIPNTQMILNLCGPSWAYNSRPPNSLYQPPILLLTLPTSSSLRSTRYVQKQQILHCLLLSTGKAPTKQCSLNSAPTWLIKRVLPLSADIFAKVCITIHPFMRVSFPGTSSSLW